MDIEHTAGEVIDKAFTQNAHEASQYNQCGLVAVDELLQCLVKTLTTVIFAMINVVGGYMVTDRMLAMFKGKREVRK